MLIYEISEQTDRKYNTVRGHSFRKGFIVTASDKAQVFRYYFHGVRVICDGQMQKGVSEINSVIMKLKNIQFNRFVETGDITVFESVCGRFRLECCEQVYQ
jgi:hypothetical protein